MRVSNGVPEEDWQERCTAKDATTRNSAVLADFVKYCCAHPSQRFWQALRNWAGVNFILTSELPPYELSKTGNLKDTFYVEGKEIQ